MFNHTQITLHVESHLQKCLRSLGILIWFLVTLQENTFCVMLCRMFDGANRKVHDIESICCHVLLVIKLSLSLSNCDKHHSKRGWLELEHVFAQGGDLHIPHLHVVESCEDGWERNGHRGRETWSVELMMTKILGWFPISMARWWFQRFLYVHLYLGKWSNLTNIFKWVGLTFTPTRWDRATQLFLRIIMGR